ncbi:MAG: SH3 domain-containing protein [Candidatus Latescibacteria bacterium]|nr:SH3 domain-containing protein [Candidatus Latescibacterota bacterium]NIO56132.1 SH3 domain-containing protein [Candidatus Latescibacterota bacterium]
MTAKNHTDHETGAETRKQLPDGSDQTTLENEVKRLLDFKLQHVHDGNLTPCPKCSQLVHVDSIECLHCGADIAGHVATIREELQKLDAIGAELHKLRKATHPENDMAKSMEHTFWERVKSALPSRRDRENLSVALPAFILYFSLVVALRVLSNGALFWSVSLAGGAVGYSMLRKSRIRKRVTVDAYRAALVLGLLFAMSTAIVRPIPFWPSNLATSITVVSIEANIRETPTTDSPIVTTLRRGATLTVVDREGAWFKVRTEEGTVGWVYSGLVSDSGQ